MDITADTSGGYYTLIAGKRAYNNPCALKYYVSGPVKEGRLDQPLLHPLPITWYSITWRLPCESM